MANSLFSSEKKEETVFLFDITSSSVGGSVVKFSKNREPVFIEVAREKIIGNSQLEPAKFFSSMVATLDKVTRDVAERGMLKVTALRLKRPKTAFVVLSSPWCASDARVVFEKRKNPFTVTSEFLNQKIRAEEVSFENSLWSDGRANDHKKEIEVVERKVLNTRLNGYETPEPYGKEALEFFMTLIISVTSRTIAEKIRKVIEENLDIEQIELHSFLMASFLSLREVAGDKNDFVFINVGGEDTEVMAIKKGTVTKTASFSQGRETLLRRTSAQLDNVPPHLVVSLLNEYASGKDFSEKLKTAAEVATEAWRMELMAIFEKFSKEIFLPKDVFITTDRDTVSVFTFILKNMDMKELIFSDNPLNVKIVDELFLKNQEQSDKENHNDHFLAMEAVFLNSLWQRRSV
ncbi:MAG: hypothetical protein Q8P86_02935 [bacterium]|nr:hypothetical protein [bacterium]